MNRYRIGGIPGTRVDIVGNVINLVSVRWVVDFLVSLSDLMQSSD